MAEWSKWKWAAVVGGAGVLSATLSAGSVVAYWKLETPAPLKPVQHPKFVSTKEHSSVVLDVPAREYAYLGPFVFSTKTVDLEGNVVWATQWTPYKPGVGYKYVTPDSLSPGLFSVVLAIDYRVNPLTRAEDEVKFLDLVVEKEKQ